MASYDLIDKYLATLRAQLRWRGETEDLDSELRDHLYTAAEEQEANGLGRHDAQRAVLDRFGEPMTVSSAFASSGTKGLAVPTRSTKSSGQLAFIAALAWIMVPFGFAGSYAVERSVGEWDGPVIGLFLLGQMSLMAAASLTVVTFIGLFQRHGGLGPVGRTGIGIAALGAAAGLIGWFIYGWGTLIGVGALLIAGAMLRRGLAPRVATVMIGTAGLWAAAVGGTLWLFEAGPRDQYGDYPLVGLTSVGVGCTLLAVGLVGIGRWLWNEEPVENLIPGSATVG
ncbi:MAG: hypothetical protein HKN03_02690 [Acidimicrobiales bacterium]|nr:hypothetical protein [Acidimicrobiales bacterium]